MLSQLRFARLAPIVRVALSATPARLPLASAAGIAGIAAGVGAALAACAPSDESAELNRLYTNGLLPRDLWLAELAKLAAPSTQRDARN